MNKNKGIFILTSIIILLPIIIGLILWNQLPDQIATHFDLYGTADGFSDKEFTVFGIPCFLLAVHLFCIIITSHDPKRQNVTKKVKSLVYWICPVMSIFTAVIIYPNALGFSVSVTFLSGLFIGLMFIVVGNYLPKCRQNYTVGIKIPWTLSDEENWNKTHRIAGKLWVIGGCIIIINSFLQIYLFDSMITIICLLVFIPCIYSFFISRQKEK